MNQNLIPLQYTYLLNKYIKNAFQCKVSINRQSSCIFSHLPSHIAVGPVMCAAELLINLFRLYR